MFVLMQVQYADEKPRGFPSIPELRSLLNIATKQWPISPIHQNSLIVFLKKVLEERNQAKTALILAYGPLIRKILNILKKTPQPGALCPLYKNVLKLIGAITLNMDALAEKLLKWKTPALLINLDPSYDQNTLRLILWILSNIAAGPESHIEALLETEGFNDMIMEHAHNKCHSLAREAHWVVLNLFAGSRVDLRRRLLLLGYLDAIGPMLAMSPSNKKNSILLLLKELAMDSSLLPFVRVHNVKDYVLLEDWDNHVLVHVAGFYQLVDEKSTTSYSTVFPTTIY